MANQNALKDDSYVSSLVAEDATSIGNTQRLRTDGANNLKIVMSGAVTTGSLTLVSATSPAAASTVAQTPLTGLGGYQSLMILATLQGATGGTLDVYVQVSPDAGTTWADYIHFPQLAAAAASISYMVPVSSFVGPNTPMVVGTGTGVTLAANQTVGGEFGDRMRAVFKAGAGTSAGATQTITVLGKS